MEAERETNMSQRGSSGAEGATKEGGGVERKRSRE